MYIYIENENGEYVDNNNNNNPNKEQKTADRQPMGLQLSRKMSLLPTKFPIAVKFLGKEHIGSLHKKSPCC